jgi:crotonobetainyl-CoA:carnitine CoA-transferase CaiB-like acyl-CoA transferase
MTDPGAQGLSAFAGLRVVELGVWVAGPACAGLLGDWGADVVKVEPPAGDPMRALWSATAGADLPVNPPFDLDNRSKRSVVLDLRADDGKAALERLLGEADVFVTNLRPDALERLGLGHADVRARHPHLVYCSVTGYGLDGPDAGRAGYDVGAYWARAGHAASLTVPGEVPPTARGGVGDHITGLAAAAGVCAALVERSRTGEGRLVETSLLRTGVYTLGWDLGIQQAFGKLLPPQPRTESSTPLVSCYRCGDGRWLWLLGLEADRHFPGLCRAIGREDLLTDDRFAGARARRVHATELVAIFDEAFATRDRAAWAAAFDEHDVWWAPVQGPAEVAADPQVAAAGAWWRLGEEGPLSAAPPVGFGERDVVAPRPPALGEHTADVLADGFGH